MQYYSHVTNQGKYFFSLAITQITIKVSELNDVYFVMVQHIEDNDGFDLGTYKWNYLNYLSYVHSQAVAKCNLISGSKQDHLTR